jgi:hypothetical protein
MKRECSVLALITTVTLLVSTGCSKQEPPASPATTRAPGQEKSAVSPKAAVEQPATPAAEPRATEAVKPVTSVAGTTVVRSSASLLATNLPSTLQSPKLSLGESATNLVQAATAASTNEVAVLLEKAKGLVSNQKYQEAINTVQQLYATKLTPEQRQTADNLKNQAQAALAKQATNAMSVLDNILGGKK